MENSTLKCKKCGTLLQLKGEMKKIFCSHCGKKNLIPKAIKKEESQTANKRKSNGKQKTSGECFRFFLSCIFKNCIIYGIFAFLTLAIMIPHHGRKMVVLLFWVTCGIALIPGFLMPWRQTVGFKKGKKQGKFTLKKALVVLLIFILLISPSFFIYYKKGKFKENQQKLNNKKSMEKYSAVYHSYKKDFYHEGSTTRMQSIKSKSLKEYDFLSKKEKEALLIRELEGSGDFLKEYFNTQLWFFTFLAIKQWGSSFRYREKVKNLTEKEKKILGHCKDEVNPNHVCMKGLTEMLNLFNKSRGLPELNKVKIITPGKYFKKSYLLIKNGNNEMDFYFFSDPYCLSESREANEYKLKKYTGKDRAMYGNYRGAFINVFINVFEAYIKALNDQKH